ncbi:MAG: thiamine biosynthesis protein ThiS [Novosphingobium sp. 28-62-57]|uniref:MoaD/ThiS family protein n=1 Tax=unclassified Novosphingobium TaxID=2644732 RepID=UPI000BD3E7E2|nr:MULTISPECIES: MoaD/ThiS family protein [unclassified Novosphingobium]OYW51036.1 MAG: thiamine biosynthesis protein ThiS [Novosphingobium sp. 12-62-10]OYZ11144.1 MAG: thiamine biosynthesis protein ThiS [Novosphingobium sp. 28-62-57]OZA35422.1 MAG: thiamine biosynthesis protein ThiS [Novosphingobium sp. 17-62-9]HQS71383.1 MoaD/ThiS family protein [Novosphingobium sp.]
MARLVFMGRLEDVAGTGEMSVAPGPVEQVLAALDPALAVQLLGEKVRMALNGQLLTDMGGVTLGQGDELAFLPPVSGG